MIAKPVRYDAENFIIYDANNKMLCDMYGKLSTDDKAKALSIASEIVAAINRDSPEWVAVEDRLPPEDGYYLATVGAVGIDPDETTCHELNWFKGKWYLPNDEMIEMEPVIAWREKPNPYTKPDASDGGGQCACDGPYECDSCERQRLKATCGEQTNEN